MNERTPRREQAEQTDVVRASPEERAAREAMLRLQVERLAHHMQTIEHDYKDLLTGPLADLHTSIHCCRLALDRFISRPQRPKGAGE